MLQQKGERVMNGLGRNDLVIVQDEDDVFLIVSSTKSERGDLTGRDDVWCFVSWRSYSSYA